MEEGEGPAYVYELTTSSAAVWTLLSLALFAISSVGLVVLHRLTGWPQFVAGAALLLWPVAILAVLPVHELVHAAVLLLAGGRPGFGAGVKAGMPYLYVTDPGGRFPRDWFIAIGLAPFVLIDLVSLAVLWLQPAWSWAIPAFVANTSGSSGDLWMVALLLRFPRWSLAEDRKTGFALWAPPGADAEPVRARAPRRRLDVPPWLNVGLVTTLAALALLPIPEGLVMSILRPRSATLPLLAIAMLAVAIGALAAFVSRLPERGRRRR